MFEFFTALFGGIYYGSKILADKSLSKQYNENRASAQLRKTAWICKYTNEDIERELKAFIVEQGNANAVSHEILPVIQSVWEFVENVKKSGRYVVGSDMTSNAVLRILMAKRGLFVYNDALRGAGFSHSQGGGYGSLEAYNIMDVAVLAWCTDEVHRVTGMEEPFVYFYHEILGSGKKARAANCLLPVVNVDDNVCRFCKLGWDLDHGRIRTDYFSN